MTRSACVILETQNKVTSVTIDGNDLSLTSGTFTIEGTTAANDNDLVGDWSYDIKPYWARYHELESMSRAANPKTYMRPEKDWITSSTGTSTDKGGGIVVRTNVGMSFKQRPYANRWIPDPLIPIEAQVEFAGADGENIGTMIGANRSQMILIDYYIDRNQTDGTYTGNIPITVDNQTITIPITIIVKDHVMRDKDRISGQGWLQYTELAHRVVGNLDSGYLTNADAKTTCTNGMKMLARDRMRITGTSIDEPSDILSVAPCNFEDIMDGTAFSSANDYDGPYLNTPLDFLFSTPFGLFYNYVDTYVDYQQPCSYPIANYTSEVSDYIDLWASAIGNTYTSLDTFITYTLDEWGKDTGS